MLKTSSKLFPLNFEEPASSLIGSFSSSITHVRVSRWPFQGDKLSNARKKLQCVVRYAEKRSRITSRALFGSRSKYPMRLRMRFQIGRTRSGVIEDRSNGRPVAGECGGGRALITSVMSLEKPSDCSRRRLNLFCL
jgi:hypothetical protein